MSHKHLKNPDNLLRNAFCVNFVNGEPPFGTPEPHGDHYLNILAGHLGGSAIIFSPDPNFTEYLKKNGFWNGDEIDVGKATQEEFPGGSPEEMLLEILENGAHPLHEKIKKQMQGIDGLLMSFVTETSIKIANITGLPLNNIARTQQADAREISRKANSKTFLREQADQYSYAVPTGFSLTEPKDLENIKDFVQKLLEDFKKHVPESPREESRKMKLWIKYDSLSGGDGVIPLEIQKEENSTSSFLGIIQQLISIGEKLKFFSENDKGRKKKLEKILSILPIVVEADLNTLPDTERTIANFNVQAFISDDDIEIIDTSAQRTSENGNYLGNELPLTREEELHRVMAEKTFLKTCKGMQESGYRGYCGGDIMVLEKEDGSITAIIFDFNGRPNASTPFLRQVHKLQKELDQPIYALNTNLTFPYPVDFMEFKRTLGDLLYQGEGSKHEGVIPTAFRSRGEILDPVVKVSIVARTREQYEKMLENLSEKGIRIS